jgi:general secretion pathway protein L
MEYLTQILPDDTYLYALDVQKTKITASGHTVDASALLQKLSSDPRLKNVKAPTAVVRLPGATKEAFVIEFTMEPVPVAVSAAPGAAAAVPSVAAVPTAAASSPAAAAASVVAATASAAGRPAAAVVAPAPAPAVAQKQGAPANAAAGSSPFVIGGTR